MSTNGPDFQSMSIEQLQDYIGKAQGNKNSSVSQSNSTELTPEKAVQVIHGGLGQEAVAKGSNVQDNPQGRLQQGMLDKALDIWGNFSVGVAKGALDTVEDIASGASRLVGAKDTANRIQSDKAAMDKNLSEYYAEGHETSSKIGELAGSTLPYMAIGGAGQAVKGASWIGKAATNFMQGAIPGAVAGIGSSNDSDSVGSTIGKGAMGAALGGTVQAVAAPVLGKIGSGIASGVKSLFSSGERESNAGAVAAIMDKIGPYDPSVNEHTQDIAQKMMQEAKAANAIEINNAYKSAFSKDLKPGTLDALRNDPKLGDSINYQIGQLNDSPKGKDILADRFNQLMKTNPDNPETIDILKKSYDDLLYDSKGMPKQSIGPNQAFGIKSIQKAMTSEVDNQVPEYAYARMVAGDRIDGVNAIKDSWIGKVAKMSDEQLKNTASKMLDPKNDPLVVSGLRDRMMDNGYQDGWRGIIRGNYQQQLDSSSVAGTRTPWDFMSKVLGDDNQRKMIMNATDRPELQDIRKNMQWMTGLYDSMKQIESQGKGTAQSLIDGIAKKFNSNYNDSSSVAKDFNEKVIDFISTNKYASQFDNIYNNPKLSDAEKVQSTISMFFKQSPANQVTRNVIKGTTDRVIHSAMSQTSNRNNQ